ncbi:PREDICTED: uncharacterized protein LOC106809897 isoform X2 [Priapulus caudatus]|uniref:Uncharacterized protein LOC106809897 isoform X2 n=1 Tax=Priapulus caudatus TaxID=37621 RepID=A0ABM1E8V1_PRICU|nr:PREDICTED: uncharacterized protein LOC106809897 isoform X2 [Priapulus caudatus]
MYSDFISHTFATLLILLLYSCKVAVGQTGDIEDEELLCRRCGHKVTSAEHLYSNKSPLALSHRNDTILGHDDTLIQLFQNAHENRFELITVKQADVYRHGVAVYDASWFPSYAWRITVCPRCGQHLGWSFEKGTEDHHSKKYVFYGLILADLLHKDYVQSLLIVPKAYRTR